MGCTASALSLPHKPASGHASDDEDCQLLQPTPQEKLLHARLAGTEPISVALFGANSHALASRTAELLNDLTPRERRDVRVVRRTPATTTVFTTSALASTLLDVAFVPGDISDYSDCDAHPLAYAFTVDLAAYDEPESSPTSLKAALKQFEKLCITTSCTHTTPIVLVLDNADVFAKKLACEPLGAHFPDYAPPPDADADADAAGEAVAAGAYVAERFYALNADAGRVMYSHFSSSKDIELARVMSAFVEDTLLRRLFELPDDADAASLPEHTRRRTSRSLFPFARLGLWRSIRPATMK